jgi:hypothetical protein
LPQLNISNWKLSNDDLQALLNVLIEISYKDDSDNFLITIDIDEIKFQDNVIIEDDYLLTEIS